jgi:hypothetical protein
LVENARPKGRDKGRGSLRRKQYQLALQGNPTMLIWLGKQWLNQGGPASYVFGGWQLQGIVTLSTGAYFTVTGANVCGCAAAQWVNSVKPGHGKLDKRTPDRWFDASAFALPAVGFNGNTGRRTNLGPGLKAWDFSTMRKFSFSESISLQFRGEFFNISNRPHFDFPDSNISSGSVGTITTAADGRSIQFGLKLVW